MERVAYAFFEATGPAAGAHHHSYATTFGKLITKNYGIPSRFRLPIANACVIMSNIGKHGLEMQDENEILSNEATAAMLGRCTVTLARWRANGKGPPHLNGLGYRRGALLAWLAARESENGKGQMTKTHTALVGSVTTGLALARGVTVPPGVTHIYATTGLRTGACALYAGCAILLAGDTEPYTLISDAVQPNPSAKVRLHISPPLRYQVAGGESVAISSNAGPTTH